MCYPLSAVWYLRSGISGLLSAGWLSRAAVPMLLPKRWRPAYPSSDGACKPYQAPNNAHLVNRAVIGAIGVIVGKHAPRLGKFHNMRAAIAADDWRLAAAEALDSKWARQLPARAAEIAGLLRG